MIYNIVNSLMYHSSLVGAIVLASHYRNVEDAQMKKNYGTGIGMILGLLICGSSIFHSIFLIAINIIIIQYCDKRYLTSLSFMLNWVYLIYIHYKCGFNATYIAWFYQNMVLRLVGLAFEIDIHERTKVDSKAPVASTVKTPVTSTMKLPVPTVDPKISEPSPIDIITYAFFFVGIHKGPYYKWKTFEDHFNTPFATLGDCRIITNEMIKKACIMFGVYFILALNFSSGIYADPRFYKRSTDFMFLSNLPQLAKFVCHHEAMMYLATSVFTEAGFGIYPSKAHAMPGHGPTASTSAVKITTPPPDSVVDQEYNFSILKCFDNEKILFGPKMKDTLRGWDISIRYWFWACIYKSLSKGKKEVRSASAFMAWIFWRGPNIMHIILGLTLWIYVNLEEEYSNMYPVTNSKKLPWDIGYSIMRMFCLLYLTPCIVLKDSKTVVKYYNSIYWIYHVVMFLFLMVAGVAALNTIIHKDSATPPPPPATPAPRVEK